MYHVVFHASYMHGVTVAQDSDNSLALVLEPHPKWMALRTLLADLAKVCVCVCIRGSKANIAAKDDPSGSYRRESSWMYLAELSVDSR
jgi:hypothetical protein